MSSQKGALADRDFKTSTDPSILIFQANPSVTTAEPHPAELWVEMERQERYLAPNSPKSVSVFFFANLYQHFFTTLS